MPLISQTARAQFDAGVDAGVVEPIGSQSCRTFELTYFRFLGLG